MTIDQLRDGMRRVDIEGEISEVGEPRTVNLKSGGEAKVADMKLKDDTGEVRLTLWDDQIEQVGLGSRVQITNGYTNSFRGEMALQVGKFGRLTVL